MDRTPCLDADAVARRFVGLTALRWLPTGLLIPVTVLLLQSRGLSLAEVGLLSATQSLTVLVLELPTGGLADALGRRPILVAAGVLDVAALALLAVGRSFSVLALAWFLQGIFRALESGPLEAWFVDTSLAADPAAPIEQGLARAGTAIGLAISTGALTAALLGVASPTDPFTTAVAVALILRAADVAAVAHYVEDLPRSPPPTVTPTARHSVLTHTAITPQPNGLDQPDRPAEASLPDGQYQPDRPTPTPQPALDRTAAKPIPTRLDRPVHPSDGQSPTADDGAHHCADHRLSPDRRLGQLADASDPPRPTAEDGAHPSAGHRRSPDRRLGQLAVASDDRVPGADHGHRAERVRRAFVEVPGVVVGAVRLVAGQRALLALVGVELLWGAGLVTVELFSAPRLVELLGSRSEGLVVFGIVAALGWSIAGLGSAFTARIVGWHGRTAWRAGASLRITQGLAVLGIALVAGPAGLVAGYLGFYLVHGAANTVHYGMVHRLVGPEHRTTVVSANSLSSRIGALAAAPGLGALASAHGIPAAGLVAAALLAAGAPLYRIAGRTAA